MIETFKKQRVQDGDSEYYISLIVAETLRSDPNYVAKTNGCGSGGLSRKMAKAFAFIVGYNLDDACNRHDEGYSIPNKYKTSFNKEFEDYLLGVNLHVAIRKQTRVSLLSRMFPKFHAKLLASIPRIFSAIVLLAGDDAYYGKED